MNTALTDAELAQLVRRESGLIVASLSRSLGDFDVAEEAVQEATLKALTIWRADGVPERPGGWLFTTARRKALDVLRRREREGRAARRVTRIEPSADSDPDPRLPMLFACCHPSLAVEARLALTLRAVVGLTTTEIARSFLVAESTVAQRIVRAKRKVVDAAIPLRVPDPDDLAGRLDDVLTVAYLAYNATYLSPAVDPTQDRATDAIWLARLVADQLPDQPEATGLVALLVLLQSRAGARFDAGGTLVPLADQNRTLWDHEAIARADSTLIAAAARQRPGRFQLQAAIAALHCKAVTARATDWLQILTLYDLLLAYDPSPVVRLNRAIALAEIDGPEAALREVDELHVQLDDYHLFHATRAHLLTVVGRRAEADAENRVALAMTGTDAERALLRRRLAAIG